MDQLTSQLLERTQAILAAPTRDYSEIGSVHKAITGVDYDCRPCNERRIINTLETFVNQPERYALRIKEAATIMEQNTTTNYRFSKKATSNLIVLVDANGQTIKVTPETLTDERAELVLRHTAFAHNIERIPGTEPDEEEAAKKAEEERLAKLAQEQEAESQAAKEAAESEAKRIAEEEAAKKSADSTTELTIEQAKVRFFELTGTKAGTRNLKTLLAAIAEAEAAKA